MLRGTSTIAGDGGRAPWPTRLPSPCSPSVSTCGTPSSRPSAAICSASSGRQTNSGRLGVAQEVADLAGGVGGVERQVDGTGPQRAEIDHQRLGALLDLGRDAVAGLDAEIQEDLGHAGPRGRAGRRSSARCRRAAPGRAAARSAGKLRRKISNRFSFMRRSPGQAGSRAGVAGRPSRRRRCRRWRRPRGWPR